MSTKWELSVNLFAHTRILIAAWLTCSAIKMILQTKSLCKKIASQKQATCASSYQNSTASWTPLRWYITHLFHCPVLTPSTSNFSIRDGWNIDTTMRSRLVLIQQRLPLSRHWTTALIILFNGSSTIAIALCLHIARAWQDKLLHGLCGNNR